MTISLEPMAQTQLLDWMNELNAGYVSDLIESGTPPEAAQIQADATDEKCFPGGKLAAGHEVFTVVDEDGQGVGALWLGPQLTQPEPGAPTLWWVWDIAINPGHRGLGYGRQTMLLAEERAKKLGAVELGLNVFGFNTVARGLYESLGYEIASIKMRKKLG